MDCGGREGGITSVLRKINKQERAQRKEAEGDRSWKEPRKLPVKITRRWGPPIPTRAISATSTNHFSAIFLREIGDINGH